MDIPTEWVIAGFVELIVLMLAAIGIKMSRKNGHDTNGLGKAMREEMDRLREELARDRQLEDLTRTVEELRDENRRLRRRLDE